MAFCLLTQSRNDCKQAKGMTNRASEVKTRSSGIAKGWGGEVKLRCWSKIAAGSAKKRSNFFSKKRMGLLLK